MNYKLPDFLKLSFSFWPNFESVFWEMNVCLQLILFLPTFTWTKQHRTWKYSTSVNICFRCDPLLKTRSKISKTWMRKLVTVNIAQKYIYKMWQKGIDTKSVGRHMHDLFWNRSKLSFKKLVGCAIRKTFFFSYMLTLQKVVTHIDP